MTADQLAAACNCQLARAENWLDAINEAMSAYDITTPTRQAAFLAQIGHESGNLRYTREIWGPTPAQVGYEGREDLGNNEKGDGYRYMGRGLIQVTGRANYQRVSDALGKDFVSEPEALEIPHWAAMSAAWYWRARGLNALADAGDFNRITRRINGGLNGLADRVARFEKAQQVLA
jgi:putative chitinase